MEDKKNTKKRSIVLGALAVIVLIILIMFQSGVLKTGKVEPGSISPRIEKVEGGKMLVQYTEVPVLYTAVGTVRSREEIEISPRVTARIEKINYYSGDRVKKGELLVKLEDSDLKAAVDNAKEHLNRAEASFELAEKQLRRYRNLYEKKAVAEKVLDQAEEDWKSTAARKEAARHQLEQAMAKLSYTGIKSPINGILSNRESDPGDLATPGKILLSVFDPSRLMLYVPIRESLVQSVKVGDKLRFKVKALDKDYTGEVRELVPSVDPGSRTFLVKICIGAAPELMPGMFAVLTMKLGSEKQIIIPEKAVSRIGQLEYVSIVKDGGKQLRVFVRTVGIDDSSDKVRVISGLETGETLIVPDHKIKL